MDSIDYYDRYAVPYYEETVDFSMEEQLKRFVELLPESADVLDLGCGSGRDTVFLEEEGCVVTAMDGSEKMCELASIHTGKEVLHLRAEDMEFDDVFHGIWACAILGHFPPDEVKGIMRKILKALKEENATVNIMAVISMIMTERRLIIFWMNFLILRCWTFGRPTM